MNEIRFIAPEPMHSVADRRGRNERRPARAEPQASAEAREEAARGEPDADAEPGARPGGIDVLA